MPLADDRPDHEGLQAGHLLRRLAPVLTMIVVIVVGASAPLAFNRSFYFWDDSAAIGIPALRVMGDSILDGRLPLLDPTMWREETSSAKGPSGSSIR